MSRNEIPKHLTMSELIATFRKAKDKEDYDKNRYLTAYKDGYIQSIVNSWRDKRYTPAICMKIIENIMEAYEIVNKDEDL